MNRKCLKEFPLYYTPEKVYNAVSESHSNDQEPPYNTDELGVVLNIPKSPGISTSSQTSENRGEMIKRQNPYLFFCTLQIAI